MRGSREVLPRAGGRAEHRRGERAGERAGLPVPALRQGGGTREGRGGRPQGQGGRRIGGSAEDSITVRTLISKTDEEDTYACPSVVEREGIKVFSVAAKFSKLFTYLEK